MREKFLPAIRGAFFLILTGSLIFGLYGLFTDRKGVDEVVVTGVGVDGGLTSKVKNIRMREKKGGRETWELLAETVSITDNSTFMEKIKMNYLSRTEKPMELTAESGVMENSSRNVAFNGGVRVVSDQPMTLETPKIDWDNDKRLLVTDQDVHITYGRAVIDGRGLVINVSNREVTVMESVRATFD